MSAVQPLDLRNYWNEVTRPLASLAFVIPILLCYEFGLAAIGPQATRNGADVWFRHFLDSLGFGQYFLLPVLTCGILLAWHHTNRDRWKLHGGVLCGMLLESAGFGFALLLIGQLQQTMFMEFARDLSCSMGRAGEILPYLGAGIYEELLFRLMLLPLAAAALRVAGCSPRTSLTFAVLLTSLVFSAAHYRLDLMLGSFHLELTSGDLFCWPSFIFRFTAGVFFATLFLYRGFGIAVGTHALYDILVTVL